MGSTPAYDPGRLVEIAEQPSGRYTGSYTEWNGQRRGCAGHDHLTRADALACTEDRLRYRA